MFDFVTKLIGNPNERKVKQLQPMVDQINDFEPLLQSLSDEDLKQKTIAFKKELAERERSENPSRDRKLEADVLDLILPEAFAVCREASKRVLGMRHFDVQLIGGMILHKGGIAEMRTGEGKTLVATLPAYLNALTGKGVHVITVNDYLAKRDAEWMGQLYQFLGLSVGVVLSSQNSFFAQDMKRQAYQADITYGTNNEFGFDYLRDNMATSLHQLSQRPFNYAIIDEVDSILIDEARTPLIISGRLEQSAETYIQMSQFVHQLTAEADYTIDEKARNIILTEEGIDRAQALLGVDDLFDPRTQLAHHLLQALRAKELFKRDIDYVVKNNQVVIVDEFTGRLMDGRRWSDGLHQSVEAKEGVEIQDETQTLASITFQNLFRLYPKLSGMTGTAMTEEAEFGKIYNLEVTAIPTNRQDSRKNLPDMIYKNERVKFLKSVEELVDCHQQGRPVLVGTVSIEKSEYISHLLSDPQPMVSHLQEKLARLRQLYGKDAGVIAKLDALHQELLNQPSPERGQALLDDLKQAAKSFNKPDVEEALLSLSETLRAVLAIQKGIPHHVLNAKQHDHEAMIVAQAGRYGAVTIATNMAGRGTDIVLGGNPEFLTRQTLQAQDIDWHTLPAEEYARLLAENKAITEHEKEKVVALGGLHIIGTERHESRRIDNQLRGRAARQGDPGSTRFYLSLEDTLMRLFGGQRISALMDTLKVDETMPITAGLVSKAIESAQRKVESYHFDMRKNVLQYDDVLTEQRKLIYEQRRKVLEGRGLKSSFEHMIQQEMARIVSTHLNLEDKAQDWEPEAVKDMLATLHMTVPQLAYINAEAIAGKDPKELIDYLQERAKMVYHALEEEIDRVTAEMHQTHGVSVTGLGEEPLPADVYLTEAEQQERNHPLRRIEREILLSVVDSKWIDYLHGLDTLREGIGLRAYGQKDPLIEYKREAFEMFQQLTYDIQHEAVALLFRARIEIEVPMPQSISDDNPMIDEASLQALHAASDFSGYAEELRDLTEAELIEAMGPQSLLPSFPYVFNHRDNAPSQEPKTQADQV